MTTISIEAKSIKANGVSNLSSRAAKHSPFVESAVSLYRLRNDNDTILNSFPSNDDYYLGSRFTSNNAVASRLLSAVVSKIYNILYNRMDINEAEAALELEIDNFFQNASGSDLDYLINDAMRDCASADHWYKYEKQY